MKDVNLIMHDKPWESLRSILECEDVRQLTDFLGSLSPAETALSVSRLSSNEQQKLLSLLEPSVAADVIEDIPEVHAADIIEELPPKQAAAIVEELDGDLQADILAELDEEDVEAILQEMPSPEAEEARTLLSYPAESAGGIMSAEFISYPPETSVGAIIEDLQMNKDDYAEIDMPDIYIVDEEEKLVGVVKPHDLPLVPAANSIDTVMTEAPVLAEEHDSLEQVSESFKEHNVAGIPVVDRTRRVVGIVMPEAVEKAFQKRTVKQYLVMSGIVGGEEFRTMPLFKRSGRRLSWLSINIVLNIIAASIIAIYIDTLETVIALAVFLPIISDMCGCSGNQAVAVSMRELTLGLVRPVEVSRVIGKEVTVGVINGLALGLLLGVIAYLWKGNAYLGLVVGGALMANTVVSVSIGGSLPLILKRLKLDPALVASPMLTTVTDMCGFFFVLGFATLLISKLA